MLPMRRWAHDSHREMFLEACAVVDARQARIPVKLQRLFTQQADGKDEDFTHRANRTISVGTRKTARRVRITSHYEFTTDR